MDYLNINKACWNERTDVHFESQTYDVKNFIKGGNALNSIELSLLGDITGKKILHLQCHFGKDTISLSRMGAQATGIDFSEKAIERAQELADLTQSDTRFILSDVYGLPAVLEEEYDIVFTSYGTIGWLPDIDRWASVVSHFLRPGGTFVFAEFHPVVWMMSDDFSRIQYRYFQDEAIVEESDTTYTDGQMSKSMRSVGWNHGLAEVVQALLKQGLRLDSLEEFDYSPYNAFPNVIERAKGEYVWESVKQKVPYVFSLKMRK